MKLNEVTRADVKKFQLGNRIAAQVKNVNVAVTNQDLAIDKLATMIKGNIAKSKEFDTDLHDLLFDLQNARSTREREKALDRMTQMLRKREFEIK